MPNCGSQVGVLWLCHTRSDWRLAAVTPTEKTNDFQLLRQLLRSEEQVFPQVLWKKESAILGTLQLRVSACGCFYVLDHLPENPNRAVHFPDASVFRKKNPKVSQPYSKWESVSISYIIGKEFSSCGEWYEPCPLTKNDNKSQDLC